MAIHASSKVYNSARTFLRVKHELNKRLRFPVSTPTLAQNTSPL